MWYVIQTVTGKEEELLTFIRTILSKELYVDCFVIRAEWMKRLGGEWQVQVRPLFPGYVFIDTEMPEPLFIELKSVPRFSKLLGNGKAEFIPVEKVEKDFLKILTGNAARNRQPDDFKEHDRWIVKRSLVEADSSGNVMKIEGPLNSFKSHIQQINYHKRYAVVKTNFFKREQTMLFGVRLNKDLMLGEVNVSKEDKKNT